MRKLITKDQQRNIEKLHVDFANRLGKVFTDTLGSVADSDIGYVDQTTFAEFIMSLKNPSASYTFTVAPCSDSEASPKGAVVIDFPPPIAHYFVKHELGEKVDGPLTSAERGVVNKVLINTLKEFEATWASVGNVQVSDAELETNPEYIGVAKPSDTIVLIGFQIHFQHANGVVSLAYPYDTLESVLSKFDE